MWHWSVYFQGEEGEQGNDMLTGFMITFENLILLTLGKFIEYILVHVVFKQLQSAIRVFVFPYIYSPSLKTNPYIAL